MSIAVQPGHINSRKSLCAVIAAAAVVGGLPQAPAPRAHAAPNPEVEYVYDMTVRRQYNFPNNDALAYGHGVCDKVGQGEGYGQIIGDVKRDVTPNDQFAANYVVGYSVNLLCPELIWQLRNSSGGYIPPDGAPQYSTYY
ncbi:MAG: DUF732 domain-containing protein [Mycobacterium sp.]|uniref:DUF732 domain-containing protein n=1 Tax=Mycobacterium sp. TaxID=1785 RepID=UPI003C763D44